MAAYGTTQKRRSVRPTSAIEGNPDIHWRCAEGPRLTQLGHARPISSFVPASTAFQNLLCFPSDPRPG
jgi:hypothetical protein